MPHALLDIELAGRVFGDHIADRPENRPLRSPGAIITPQTPKYPTVRIWITPIECIFIVQLTMISSAIAGDRAHPRIFFPHSMRRQLRIRPSRTSCLSTIFQSGSCVLARSNGLPQPHLSQHAASANETHGWRTFVSRRIIVLRRVVQSLLAAFDGLIRHPAHPPRVKGNDD